ncbi:MAG: ferrous iron transport protein B [Ginsengibacter sp.]
MLHKSLNIALVGNPNSGKTSLFNNLTGLNQKVGNFPGVTVDKKTGTTPLTSNIFANVIDLPGTYSLYPKRHDEWVTYRVLLNQDADIKPDVILLVADASNLKRNLLFCSQIIDLKIPVVVAFTMLDIAKKKNIQIDFDGLERELGVPIVSINPRKNKGIAQLKKVLEQAAVNLYKPPARDFVDIHSIASDAIDSAASQLDIDSNYRALHHLINYEYFPIDAQEQQKFLEIKTRYQFNQTKAQAEEIMMRYARIKHIMQQNVIEADPLQKAFITEKLDNILLHRFWGYAILLLVLFLLFQSIFWIAQYPMDGIEWLFSKIGIWVGSVLQQSWFSDVLINGVLAGLSGILVFVPQIMILFGLITLLEDTGYMARISFLTDRVMRKVGLNGKSVMPMISGLACAVPAIMSARSIENEKERLLTILCTPLMSCSARLPVYTILTALIIPRKLYLGFFNLQGLVMLALYLLGTVMALLTAFILKHFIKSNEKSYFILELPVYRGARWKNVFFTMVEKAKVFVFDAGKVIMVISLLLWVLSTYGPKQQMQAVHNKYSQAQQSNRSTQSLLEKEKQTALLENSFAGILGKAIEPAIQPLGFDWKIGIALITSFAAREVFVGTMATLYSVGETNDQNSNTLRQKMSSAKRPNGSKVYTVATGLSLLVFYVLAMQCMSTLAIVKRETKRWKWPIFQFVYMTALAYVCSYVIFNLFS